MQTAEAEHQQKVAEIERSLIETRIKVQKEADAKLQTMQSEAQKKAIHYLAEHTEALEIENRKLEEELNRCNQITQNQILKKEALEKENKELEIEQKLKGDLVRLRLLKIQEAQRKRMMSQERQRTKKIEARRLEIQRVLQGKGIDILKVPSTALTNSQSKSEKDTKSMELSLLDPLDLEWSDVDE